MGWEPWTGCYKISDGCTYCYYYGPYSKRCGQNTIVKTDEFYKPIETIFMPRKKLTKDKIESGTLVNMCFTTDFFLPEADEWRVEVWQMIKKRADLKFFFLTKRIDRFPVSLPEDWGEGYDHVSIGCTVENQEIADYRLPLFLSYPIKHRTICCSPLLSNLDLSPYLHGVTGVTIGGETSRDARICDYNWVLNIREQCEKAGVRFWFKNTGSQFLKDGVLYKINPRMQHSTARDLNININQL